MEVEGEGEVQGKHRFSIRSVGGGDDLAMASSRIFFFASGEVK